MLFNSLDFAIFLPIVFVLYWLVTRRNLKLQNLLILTASYVFYGWWDWRYLSLILISTVIDYFVGRGLAKEERQRKRKLLLLTSIIVNIALLGFFKYYNFFIDNFIVAFSYFGLGFKNESLNIILPVGISFYTFQTMSYSIEVYKRKIIPTSDFVAFSAFVSFFPQLVAGPIERADHLLPQFYTKRKFDYQKAVDGLRQILWGLFKKMVVADNCAYYSNLIFNNSAEYSGSTLLMGALFFAFQIYGDFSGYSDIAIGTARLFGFDLMRNFAYPYFSRDIAEFWRRWHISLTTWFRDYLYIPMGGSHRGTSITTRNTLIVFVVSGFWHGANWTYIVWGILNALYFLPLQILNRNRINTDTVASGKRLPEIKELLQMAFTFFLTVLAWIFFRAETVKDSIVYLMNLLSLSLFSIPSILSIKMLIMTNFIFVLVIVEWIQRERQHGLQMTVKGLKSVYRWSVYAVLITAILYFGGSEQQFIYFQF